MPTEISSLSQVAPSAKLGANVQIGPFCVVGPDAEIGDETVLDSHVAIVSRTKIGARNRFLPGCVIGAEPQDISYRDAETTRLEIGDDNIFREGVTVNRGAEKEDHVTLIGNRNMLMANSHVAHNCRIFNNTILVNGVLLGGHVHIQDGAIVSGNSVVHHFSTIGTLAFVSGGCRVPNDVPPYMLASGKDRTKVKTVNLVGMRRAGISESTIQVIKRAHRLLYREHYKVDLVRETLVQELGPVFPYELSLLLKFVEKQNEGRLGRGRETARTTAPPESPESSQRKAA